LEDGYALIQNGFLGDPRMHDHPGDTPMEHPPLHAHVALGEDLVHIDPSFEPLVPKFLTNRKKEVVTMQDALSAQDFETVRTVAHGMKGAGGSYGFDRVTEIAAVVEQAAKTGDSSTIECHLPLLGSYLDRVQVVYD
jgi:HPt (histidine-containing phosphotransfer) domain-containing protein